MANKKEEFPVETTKEFPLETLQSEERFRYNILIRKKAEEIYSLVAEELVSLHYNDAQKGKFWDCIFGMVTGPGSEILEIAIKNKSPEAMTYDEAREWASIVMIPFGQHTGETVINVPSGYLEWLESQSDFRKDLRRYMKSRYYQDLVMNIDQNVNQEESEDDE